MPGSNMGFAALRPRLSRAMYVRGASSGVIAIVLVGACIIGWTITEKSAFLGGALLLLFLVPVGMIRYGKGTLDYSGAARYGLGYGIAVGSGLFFEAAYIAFRELDIFVERMATGPGTASSNPPTFSLDWWALPLWIVGGGLIGVVLALLVQLVLRVNQNATRDANKAC